MILDAVPQSTPQFAASNGLQLCYDTFGTPTDPPIVLVMGLAAQMILWEDDFCRELAARGFWVIRFDNRDIGKSTKFSDSRTPRTLELLLSRIGRRVIRPVYRLRDMALDTLGLMDALGIAKAHLVGASMGGMIVQEIAMLAPQRLISLTSIMSSTGDPKLPTAEPDALAALMKPTPLARDAYLARYVATWSVLSGSHFPFDAEHTRRQGEAAFARGINPPGVARQMQAIIASGNRTRGLGKVRVPALVIHGSADPLVPPEAGRATARAIPGAKLVIIEGMGHSLPRKAWTKMIDAISAHATAAGT